VVVTMSDKQGAIDNDFGDAEQTYEQRISEALDGIETGPRPGGIAIDIVTRQAVYVRQQVAETCADYYEEENFDLVTYKMHPWLPGISPQNAVFECSYIDGNPQNTHKQGRTYDFPSARLMHLPVELSWNDAEVGDV
jgi:hypothetical protein